MSLIADTIELSTLVGNALSVSTDFSGLSPFIDSAEARYIRKAIGDEQADDLAGVAVGAPKIKLQGLIKKSLAFYALYEYSGFQNGQQTNNGLQEITIKEKSAPGRKWVSDERRAKNNDLGAAYLDQALEHLIKNRALFPLWSTSSTGVATLNLLVQDGEQLRDALPASKGSYTLYLTLLPYIKKAEARELIEICGPTIIANLKARRVAGGANANDIALLPYLQEVVANVAYKHALINLIVVQTPDSGLRVLSEFDGTQNRQKLTKEERAEYTQAVNENASRAQAQLKAFLDKNSASYPDYTSWSGYTTSLGVDGILQAEKYTTVFPLM